MTELRGIAAWLNSPPLSTEDLRDRVILIHFWTSTCPESIQAVPHLLRWHERYGDNGLIVVGVHSPEFPFEHELAAVKKQVARLGITYPVALDNDHATWDAYGNQAWPSSYLMDTQGRVRHRQTGARGFAETEAIIRMLLQETGAAIDSAPLPKTRETGDHDDVTPSMILGYDRMERLGSPETLRMDRDQRYTVPLEPTRGMLYLDGTWEIRKDRAVPKSYGAGIVCRVHAARMGMVLDGTVAPSRAQIMVDGKDMKTAIKGSDVGRRGETAVVHIDEARLYDVIDGTRAREMLLDIRFLEPGTEVYAVTFG